jgi:membrane protein
MAVARRILASLKNDGVWLRSAGVAYCIVFALIPGFAAPVILYGLVGNADAVQRPVGLLNGLLPPDAIKFLADQLKVVAQTSRVEVGAGLGSALLAALWASWSGASGVIAAINSAYREEESRTFAKRAALALIIAIGTGVFLLVALTILALVPLLVESSPVMTAVGPAVRLARWPVLAILCAICLATLYRYAPDRRRAKWRWLLPGAVAGTAVWLSASAAFSLYAASVQSYQHAFGALGSFMLLLTWSYLAAFAVLLGAELNAELERQTSRDTTEGPERQVGSRGAVVADRT